MAAPNALKSQLGDFLDAAWDAHLAGTLRDHDWEHDSVEMTFGARRLIASVQVERAEESFPRFIIMIKRVA